MEYFGKSRLLTDIADTDVAKLVATRRAAMISNATVNRSTTGMLRTLFAYAKSEGVRFEHEPQWLRHMLTTPEERVRELHGDEADRIEAAMRADYEPFFAFVRDTGMRQKECVTLRWSEVNWGSKQIVKLGKGGKRIIFPITPTIRAILWPLQGHHPEFCFTYTAQRTIEGRFIKGQRYPLTVSGVKTNWRRLRKAAGVSDFRFHDFRHDFATRVLRRTENLKLTQKTLNHADIRTTLKYAHVLDDEIAAAIEDVAKSREKPRGHVRKVS